MSTGSVSPFTPSGPTQALSVGTVSATDTFIPGDALLLYNSGTVPVFVVLGLAGQTINATVPTPGTIGSAVVPPGVEYLLGTPNVVGNNEGQIAQIGAIAASGVAELYITPGLGTKYRGMNGIWGEAPAPPPPVNPMIDFTNPNNVIYQLVEWGF